MARTSLISLIFDDASNFSSRTVNTVFAGAASSSSAGAAAPAAGPPPPAAGIIMALEMPRRSLSASVSSAASSSVSAEICSTSASIFGDAGAGDPSPADEAHERHCTADKTTLRPLASRGMQ